MGLLAAALFGIAAGLRVFTAEAVFFGLRGAGWPRIIFPMFALGEYVADASPWIPARTQIFPSLLLRLLSGAFMGHVAAGFGGLVLGAIGAIFGTFAGYQARITAIAKIGAYSAAIAEDVIAIALAFVAVRLI
jgi:uncharacterized membrane protein